MRSSFVSAVAVLSLSSAAATVRAQSSPAYPPTFVDISHIQIFEIAPPSVTTFSFTGQVIDQNPEDIVTIIVGPMPPLFDFTTTPGNPATFTISGHDLDYGATGRYSIIVAAFDNSPGFLGSGILFEIYIVPEPTFLATVLLPAAGLARRRR